MTPFISRFRARKAKARARQAGKTSDSASPSVRRTLGVILMGGLTWVVASCVVALPILLAESPERAEMIAAVGDSLMLLLALGMMVLFFRARQPTFQDDFSRFGVVALISLSAFLIGRLILDASVTLPWLRREAAVWLAPYVLAPLVTGVLLDPTAAITTGLWTSLAFALMTERSLVGMAAGALATLVATTLAHKVSTRAEMLKAGSIAGLSQVACVCVSTAWSWRTPSWTPGLLAEQAAACVFSGVFSAMLALVLMPLLEMAFHITTDIRLLELSDLRHPLLQRLALEAPGTYHHSLMVASLAQAAAQEIGAHSLLTRVGAYFHDVGKLTKPEFFSENIRGNLNPHDDLPPSMSCLILTAHVKEGLSLAALHRLPSPIRRIIAEHHGTSLLSYFKYKAWAQREQPPSAARSSDTAASHSEEAFRYPGPKPSSRESAIVCLADAVEAASRAMEKVNPAHVEDLVAEIVTARLEDGQFDDCGLTLAEVARIRRALVFALANMLHSRVPYPHARKSYHRSEPAEILSGRSKTNT